mgnify:FL=1
MSNQYPTLRYKLDQRGIKPKEGCVMSDTINNHDVITSYFEEVDITIAIDDFGIANITHVNGIEVKED